MANLFSEKCDSVLDAGYDAGHMDSAVSAPPLPGTSDAEELVEMARRAGFMLVQFETDSGQAVWEWRRHGQLGPLFVTRRVALHWMADWVRRDGSRTLT
jgi:hypothetical protein